MRDWETPPDLDPECLSLCRALNAVPGIKTIESCCGHGTTLFAIYAWSVAQGALDGFCERCRGAGVVIRSPCRRREDAAVCSRETGCEECRSTCPRCKGARVEPAAVLSEDFGDAESRQAAQQMFPGLVVEDGKRIDMHAPALGR